ncbi:MAG: hypothetical protein ACOYKA_04595, partial [Legionellaceae bacterium]
GQAEARRRGVQLSTRPKLCERLMTKRDAIWVALKSEHKLGFTDPSDLKLLDDILKLEDNPESKSHPLYFLLFDEAALPSDELSSSVRNPLRLFPAAPAPDTVSVDPNLQGLSF